MKVRTNSNAVSGHLTKKMMLRVVTCIGSGARMRFIRRYVRARGGFYSHK